MPAPQEINVIGCTVEEATRRVDKFLDEAALAGKPSMCASFMATGRARCGGDWREFLPTHPLVDTDSSGSGRSGRKRGHGG